MTETKGKEKLVAWNRFINAMLNAEKQWKAYNKLKVDVDTLFVQSKVRRAMTTYAKASDFGWFLESFMRYVKTSGGMKAMLLELKREEKEVEDART